jgi:hypothetical protein
VPREVGAHLPHALADPRGLAAEPLIRHHLFDVAKTIGPVDELITCEHAAFVGGAHAALVVAGQAIEDVIRRALPAAAVSLAAAVVLTALSTPTLLIRAGLLPAGLLTTGLPAVLLLAGLLTAGLPAVLLLAGLSVTTLLAAARLLLAGLLFARLLAFLLFARLITRSLLLLLRLPGACLRAVARIATETRSLIVALIVRLLGARSIPI